ncbi:MAG TPA: cupin domain-containing protein [Myxococcaceae bacterium]|jgi:quercetin dioxygenase-like cupin family protein|nr:cupin domain-containing protein [Myxococcaceae bacterium]
MPVFNWSELQPERVDGDWSPAMAPVVRGAKIAAARITYRAGSEVRRHVTTHEEIHSVIAGRARYSVGGEERMVGAGEAVLIAPGSEYGVRALEDVEIVAFRDVTGGPDAKPEPGTPGMFFSWSDLKSDFITPKYSSGRGPTVSGRRIEVAYMFYPGGTRATPHSHPNEQIQVALKGRVTATIAGQRATFGAGEGVLFPSGVEHGVEIVEDYTTINCKDIVPGWSVYKGGWDR